MSFKDIVRDDINRVFLNQDDFAEEHVLDGVKVVCVITQEADLGTIKNGRILGNIEADCVVRGKAEDLLYDSQSYINVDGREYLVAKVETAMGVTELYLQETHTM